MQLCHKRGKRPCSGIGGTCIAPYCGMHMYKAWLDTPETHSHRRNTIAWRLVSHTGQGQSQHGTAEQSGVYVCACLLASRAWLPSTGQQLDVQVHVALLVTHTMRWLEFGFRRWDMQRLQKAPGMASAQAEALLHPALTPGHHRHAQALRGYGAWANAIRLQACWCGHDRNVSEQE